MPTSKPQLIDIAGEPIRILHVCNRFYPCVGGIETYVLNLSRRLLKRGHVNDVLCLNTCHNSKKVLAPFESYGGINIYRVPYIDLKYYLVAPSVFGRLKNYDVVHVHGVGFFSDFLALTKPIHKKNMVLSIYGGVFHTKNIMVVKNIYFFGWCRLIFNKFKKIIAISPEDKNTAAKISRNVELVDAGIDYARFSSVSSLKNNARKNVCVCVGRISKNKRVDNLVKTVFYLKKEAPDILLYVIGDDWENLRGDLEKLVNESGLQKNVVFTGKVSDGELLDYLAEANLFLSASEYESFGLSVVESMAAGCVPVLNSIEIFKNLITDGENGFIVDFANPESAAKRIAGIIKKNLESIRKKSVDFSRKYDWDEKVASIEKIYFNALDNK